MGLLDGALGGALRGSGLGGGGRGRSAMVNALLLALAAKAVQSYLKNRAHPAQTQAAGTQGQPQTAPAGGGLGGLGGMLGGLLGGGAGGLGGLGGMLGSLGGAGALGGLLNQFNQRGLPQAQSWVATGPNQPIAPQQLADALDDHDVQQLADATGLPKDQVLHEVAQALPEAIDHLTPNGRLPTESELADLMANYEAQANAH